MATSNTVIIGAGIIGCSTAYYLSQSSRTPTQNIHLVEASDQLFNCASGYAGGFLAADWFSPAAASLGALSFRLHKELAESNNGRDKWGYASTVTSSLTNDNESAVGGSGEDWLRDGSSRSTVAAENTISGEDQERIPAWLTQKDGDKLEQISTKDTTAQVDPLLLSKWLLSECIARGVTLHYPAQALSVFKDIRDTLSSVRILDSNGVETDIPCQRIIITAGAWTPSVLQNLFPESPLKLQIGSLAGHSLLLRSPRWTKVIEDKGCQAVFSTDTSGFSPEIFARLNGELYIAGLNTSSLPLPGKTSDVVAEPNSIQRLKSAAERLLGLPAAPGSDIEVVRESLCFRPVSGSGRPMIGRVPDDKLGAIKTRGGADGGVFIAAGHGAWGISQSLGTGKVLSELVEGEKPSADIMLLSVH